MIEGAVLVTWGHLQRSGMEGSSLALLHAQTASLPNKTGGVSLPFYHLLLEEAWKRSSCGHVAHGQQPLEVTVVGSCCFLDVFQGL